MAYGAGAVKLIAEIGINHNGDFKLAEKMVYAAYAAGADVVKFQYIVPERLYSVENANLREFFKPFVLSLRDFRRLADLTHSLGMEFMLSVFDEDSVAEIVNIVDYYKIASLEINYKLLLEEVARYSSEYGKTVVISTGASGVEEIKRAYELLSSELESYQLYVLHCISGYPTYIENLNLGAIELLKKELSTENIGLSDHTFGIESSILAVCMGAVMIEKHFTIDRTLKGPDQMISLEPSEFFRLRRFLDSWMNIVDERKIEEEVVEGVKVWKRKLGVKKGVKSGEKLTKEVLTSYRALDGIDAWLVEEVIGKEVKRDLDLGGVLKWDDLK